MKRAVTYALAAGLTLGTGSFAYAQYNSDTGSGGMQAPGSRAGTSQTQKVPESEVKAALEQHGYTDVRDVKQSGNMITAKAMKDGKQQFVEIDTRTGTLRSGS